MGKGAFCEPKFVGNIWLFFLLFPLWAFTWELRPRLGKLQHQEKPYLSRQGKWERGPLRSEEYRGNTHFFSLFSHLFVPVWTLVSCCSYAGS